MDEVSVPVANDNNRSGSEFWMDDESPSLSLFAGNFVPPPPRPLFLDDSAIPDGVTTCDLCSWAWQTGSNAHSFDANREPSGELGWVVTLVIVSLTSALIGAIVMITVMHCKRIKNSGPNEAERGIPQEQRPVPRPPIGTPDDKEISAIAPTTFPALPPPVNGMGVWSWLAGRNPPPTNLNNPPTSPVENHYTHMEDGYNMADEALYAELDRDSARVEDRGSNSPAYQNSAYTDPDAPTSSAPSSAYYSDLSVTTVAEKANERAYEVVGLSTMPSWDNSVELKKPSVRLAAINENCIPSDYV